MRLKRSPARPLTPRTGSRRLSRARETRGPRSRSGATATCAGLLFYPDQGRWQTGATATSTLRSSPPARPVRGTRRTLLLDLARNPHLCFGAGIGPHDRGCDARSGRVSGDAGGEGLERLLTFLARAVLGDDDGSRVILPADDDKNEH